MKCFSVENQCLRFTGQVVYYAGPAPAKPGKPIGSVGPTTGGRMDAYSPTYSRGTKVMIGKGTRSEVIEAMKTYTGFTLPLSAEPLY